MEAAAEIYNEIINHKKSARVGTTRCEARGDGRLPVL